jgi:HSP20 family protein
MCVSGGFPASVDPFRELDRLTQQVFGTAARPAVMPMDAWRDGEEFIVEFDLPRVKADSLYHDGVLRLTIPVAEKAKPRRIEISHDGRQTAINA